MTIAYVGKFHNIPSTCNLLFSLLFGFERVNVVSCCDGLCRFYWSGSYQLDFTSRGARTHVLLAEWDFLDEKVDHKGYNQYNKCDEKDLR